MLLDCQATFDQLVSDIKRLDTSYRTTLIYGTRGVGKTIFMNVVGRKVSSDSQWISIHLPIGDEMLGRLVLLPLLRLFITGYFYANQKAARK